MKHNWNYTEAQKFIAQAPKDNKYDIDFNKEILFTSSIVDEINRFENAEDLLKFFEENISQFGYNNATAYKYIHEVWEKIAAPEGLAVKEKSELSVGIWDIEEAEKSRITEMEKRASVWDIYLQILGFDETSIESLHTDRSIKPILNDNALLHPLAQESFPDREGIQNILNGKHVSHERVRKVIILLVFYKYWATSALKRKDATYQAQPGEADRCLSEMNRYLLDAGYPALYLGNPFDWVFMYAIQDEFPLTTFREFMHELFVIKECTFTNPNENEHIVE